MANIQRFGSVSKVKPEKLKIINVPTIDVGIEKRILTAACQLPKNKKHTKIVMSAAIQSFSVVRLTVASVDFVKSTPIL